MASDKDFAVDRNPTQDPRINPVRETESKRRERYIQTKFREDVRHITRFLHTDITKFRLGNPIIKEFMWNFQATFNTTHLQSISYFLTTIGFKEKVEENMPGLTVFRYPLPIEGQSIHVKITEQTSRIIIHAHMDKKIHTEHEHNDFTTYLLSELGKFLQNIYEPLFMRRQMKLTPQWLRDTEIQEPLKEQINAEITSDTDVQLIKKIKSQFTQNIPEIKAKCLGESMSRNRLIPTGRIREIAYQLVTSNLEQDEIQNLRHVELNLKIFLADRIDIIYSDLKKIYMQEKNKNPPPPRRQFFPKEYVKRSEILKASTPEVPAPLPQKLDKIPKEVLTEKIVEKRQITPESVLERAEEIVEPQGWGYYDEEEEFREYIDSEVTESILIEDSLTPRSIQEHPNMISSRPSEMEQSLAQQPQSVRVSSVLEEIIHNEFEKIYQKAIRDMDYQVLLIDIIRIIPPRVNARIDQYNNITAQTYRSQFEYYMKKQFNTDLTELQNVVSSERKRLRKRASIISPIRKVAISFLWCLCTVAAFYFLFYLLHIQWLPYEDLYRFFPIQCTLFLLCAFLYGTDLCTLIIVGYRAIRGRELTKTEEGLGAVGTLFCISSIAVICNFCFLFFLL